MHGYSVFALTEPVHDGELRPLRGHARRDAERVASLVEAEDGLQCHPVHPARGTRIPRPAAAADVPRGGVDIRRNHVRLDLVERSPLRRGSVVQRVEHLEQLEGAPPIAVQRRGEYRPERGVRVLRSVLAHAGHVSLDVARVVRRVIEGRREKHDEARVLANEMLLERLQCL